MKLLLIGNPKSQYVRNLVLNVLTDVEVTICSDFETDDDVKSIYTSTRNKVDFISFYGKKSNFIYKIFKIRKIAKKIKNQFDCINIQFVSTQSMIFLYFYKQKNSKIVLTFYGSDLLRAKRISSKYLIPNSIKKSSVITFDGLPIEEKLKDNYQRILCDKLRYLPFINMVTPAIDAYYTCDRSTIKKELYGEYCDKTIIVLGYNGSISQNHVKVLNGLTTMKKDILDRVLIVCPVAYGVSSEKYLDEILSYKKYGINIMLNEKYLNPEELAKLCLSSDIFVHAQTTDAFSQSFFNFAYSGANIIQGKWLHYPEIDKLNLVIHEFENYEEVGSLINKCMNDYSYINHERLTSCFNNNEIVVRWKDILLGDGKK